MIENVGCLGWACMFHGRYFMKPASSVIVVTVDGTDFDIIFLDLILTSFVSPQPKSVENLVCRESGL